MEGVNNPSPQLGVLGLVSSGEPSSRYFSFNCLGQFLALGCTVAEFNTIFPAIFDTTHAQFYAPTTFYYVSPLDVTGGIYLLTR